MALCLVFCAHTAARADDDDAKPAPRTAITIGGASVVLVSSGDKLYAFIDRLEDNTPVEDAEISIDTSEGASITMHKAPVTMNRATAGMFVGTLDRKGHSQDAFMVSLKSSAGTGDAPAEITYDDIPDSAAAPAAATISSKVAVALVSGGIGAIASVIFMLWWRRGERRGARRGTSVGSGTVRTV